MATAAGLASELQGLPRKLARFFERYPPEVYSVRMTGITLPLTRKEAKEAAIAKGQAQTAGAVKDGTEAAVESKPLSTEGHEPSSITEQSTPSSIPSSAEAAATSGAAALFQSKPEPTITPRFHLTSSQPAIEPATFKGRIVDGLTRATRFPSNPFLPFKNPTTGRWAGARVSLRRQADLCKLAREYNVEDLLPPSKKSFAFKEARIIQRGLRIKGTGEGQKVKGHKWERMLPIQLRERQDALENMPALIREWEARGHGRGWKKWPRAKTR